MIINSSLLVAHPVHCNSHNQTQAWYATGPILCSVSKPNIFRPTYCRVNYDSEAEVATCAPFSDLTTLTY